MMKAILRTGKGPAKTVNPDEAFQLFEKIGCGGSGSD
jgi:hypothetical protein